MGRFLVYVTSFDNIDEAITHEKKLKNGSALGRMP